MKVLVSWLREFVDVSASPEEIAETMSLRGFAVEGIERVGDDSVVDFEVTANRPDCMSVLGMAREVATAFGLPLKSDPDPSADGARGRERMTRGGDAGIEIVLDAQDLCPRYAGAVADVAVGPSPAWMQARLQASGVRPISNIVDITNYVLLEMGQPMHAFDLDKIGGRQIRVRTARAGETLTTLDRQERTLSTGMLVIADAGRPMAVAGIMGGAESEVGPGTTAIVFESAFFDPLSVRRTSKALGLKTEASMRFERGVDPHLPRMAMIRALDLLENSGAGRQRGGIVDRARSPFGIEPRALRLRHAKIDGLLGVAIPPVDVERILSSLGFSLVRTEEGWRASVPTRRVDVLREVDLIEEVARHYGFDRLPSTFPALASAPPPADPRIARARHLRAVMTAAGFSEAMTFGFVAEPAAVPFAPDGELVSIANPLSENFAVLRPSALPSLIDAVAHNRRREQRDVRLFEIGARFSRAQGERRSVACAWTGAAAGEHWSGGARDVDFFDIKTVVEQIGRALQIEVRTEPSAERWLAPGRSATVMAGGATIGAVGQLLPAIALDHGLPSHDEIYVAEIDIDAAEAAASADIRVEALPRYPSVTRDISILVDAATASARVRQTIRDAAPPTLVRVLEFDRYQGKGVPEGKVSLSLHLTFRSPDRTLTDAEVQDAMDAVLAALAAQHRATQR